MIKQFIIKENISIKSATVRMKHFGIKSLFVVNNQSELIGSVSGGDIRGALIKNKSMSSSIKKIINTKPKYVFLKDKNLKIKIANIFKKYKVDLVPIVDEDKKIKKIIFWSNFFQKKKTRRRNVDLKKYKLKVVIMAGGKGTRLKPFTDILPKPLMPVKNKTIVEHIINSFLKYGLSNFIISTNFKSHILKSYLNDKYSNLKLKYLDENKPLGTVGSLSNLDTLTNCLVSNCDVLHKIDLKKFIEFHFKSKNDFTMITAKKKYVIPYGVCNIENHQLVSIKEKPKINFFINTGLYLINKKIIKLIPKNKYCDVNTLLEYLLKKNYKIGTFEIKDSDWYDIGKWDQLSKTLKTIS